VDRLSRRRIGDHKMVQWSVTYLALAYAVQHGAMLTSEFRVATSCARISMLLLALGLPLVMTLALYHGERSSRHFTPAELSILAALLVIDRCSSTHLCSHRQKAPRENRRPSPTRLHLLNPAVSRSIPCRGGLAS
jgi:hypothetical protein